MEANFNTDDSNRNIVVGSAGKLATSVLISGNYLSSCSAAIEGIGFDGMAIFGNWIDVTSAHVGSPGVAFKNTGGGTRRTSAKWFGNLKVGRGTFMQEADIDDETGFSFIAGDNRDGNNIERSNFKASNESVYTILNNGTATVMPATVTGIVTLLDMGANKPGQFGVAGSAATVEISDVTAHYTVTAASGGSINFYVTGGNLTIENKTGSTVNVSFRLDK